MNFNYLDYIENDNMTFAAKEKDFITFLGNKNTTIVENLMYKKENNYITLNFSKITYKNKDKLFKQIGFSTFALHDTFIAETVKDELAYALESQAKGKNEMLERIEDMNKKFKFASILEKSPKSITISEKAKLSIARILISEPKILIIENLLTLLDERDYQIVSKTLKEYANKGNIILNFTTNIEETLLGNEIIITDNEKIIISGSVISVLNEEKLMKRLGYGLPFLALLNKYLKDYNLIKAYTFSYEGLVNKIW